MQPLRDTLAGLLTDGTVLAIWATANLASVVVLLWDIRTRNPQTGGMMKWVWGLTVLYSGPIGLAVYGYSGRRQIARDTLWRRSFRSVAHCYSGCGMGEVIGVVLAAGILTLGNLGIGVITFALAYVMGFALTIGPLMNEGEPFATAFKDAFIAETLSITVMEVTAIGIDLWLAGASGIGEPLFWSSLLFSLTVGFFAAYPVNVLLIRFGIKEGMGHPGEAHAHCH